MSHTIGNGKYLLQKVLGTGAFGQVYFSSPNYAVKQVHRGKNHR
jgi:serine/threonine protein kinase